MSSVFRCSRCAFSNIVFICLLLARSSDTDKRVDVKLFILFTACTLSSTKYKNLDIFKNRVDQCDTRQCQNSKMPYLNRGMFKYVSRPHLWEDVLSCFYTSAVVDLTFSFNHWKRFVNLTFNLKQWLCCKYTYVIKIRINREDIHSESKSEKTEQSLHLLSIHQNREIYAVSITLPLAKENKPTYLGITFDKRHHI